MNQVSTWQVAPGAWAAALLAAAVSVVGAAPTTSLDDGDATAPPRTAHLGGARPLAPNMPGAKSTDRALHPETSTGNKNLDLLLELQGRPGQDVSQVAPRSAAAASAAAAALADLRARAAERPAPERVIAEQTAAKPAVQPFEGLGSMEGDGRLAPPPAERRQWTGQPAGGDRGSSYGRSDAYRAGDRESDAIRGGYSDDNLLRRLPQEVITFLRENRYWLLGALGVVAVLGAAIKSFSRRI